MLQVFKYYFSNKVLPILNFFAKTLIDLNLSLPFISHDAAFLKRTC